MNSGTSEFRLNQFLAKCGLGSRREVEDLIRMGRVQVNGRIVREPGVRVNPKKDEVRVDGMPVQPFPFRVYLLLNKPKNVLTTRRDPQGRKTVYTYLPSELHPWIVPVGRLDRNTTGILLFTSEGELAHRLMHPRYRIVRVYHVRTDRPVTRADMIRMVEGVPGEEGEVLSAESVFWLSPDHREIELTVRQGRYRLVRRLLESLGYTVKALDRVAFGPIRSKRIPRGKWRFLDLSEVRQLYQQVGLPAPRDLHETLLRDLKTLRNFLRHLHVFPGRRE